MTDDCMISNQHSILHEFKMKSTSYLRPMKGNIKTRKETICSKHKLPNFLLHFGEFPMIPIQAIYKRMFGHFYPIQAIYKIHVHPRNDLARHSQEKLPTNARQKLESYLDLVQKAYRYSTLLVLIDFCPVYREFLTCSFDY